MSGGASTSEPGWHEYTQRRWPRRCASAGTPSCVAQMTVPTSSAGPNSSVRPTASGYCAASDPRKEGQAVGV